ncbi:MAG: CBS domain-containing protein [Thermonemataceae bacterium]|nr:CBS domain-containing protein [Thermonemataceae bacterium]
MTMHNFINAAIKPICVGDDTSYILDLMQDLHCTTLPVVDENGFFKGLIEENMLLEAWDNEINWELIDLPYTDTFAYEHQSWQEIIPLFAKGRTLIAVLNAEGRFLGAVSSHEIVAHLAQSYAFQEEGAVLVLAVHQRDYSLAEIARLVESNNVKILHLLTEIDENEPYKILVSLKINQTDASRVIATLERFNYDIVAKFHQNLIFEEIDKDRIDLLFKYLSF